MVFDKDASTSRFNMITPGTDQTQRGAIVRNEPNPSNAASSILNNVFFTKVAPCVSDGSSAIKSYTNSAHCSTITAQAVNQPRPFPQTLMELLSQEDPAIVSWLPSGNAFIVRCSKRFVSSVLPRFFHQTKLTSFQRQLNLYGFRRIVEGSDMGAYQHVLFRRDAPDLCLSIQRKKRIRKRPISKAQATSAASAHALKVSFQTVVSSFASQGSSPMRVSASAGCDSTSKPSRIDLHPCSVVSVAPPTTLSTPVGLLPSINHTRTPLTGYSIIVCDHANKSVVEVAHYSAIPCDLESFGLGVGGLLADGVEQYKRNNVTKVVIPEKDERSCVPPLRFPARQELPRNDDSESDGGSDEEMDDEVCEMFRNESYVGLLTR